MNKKCRILTFCTWTSIGSILQSYGLKQALAQLGYQSTILLPANSNEFTTTKVYSLKSFVSRGFQTIISKRRKEAHRKRCLFIKRWLDIEEYQDYTDLQTLGEVEDGCCYIAGSDQIWHPNQCRKDFFLDFLQNQKRISYAASMGKTEIPQENRDKIRHFLSKFDRISVRESQCKDVLQPMCNKDISVHIDPVFLLETEQWRALQTPYPVKGPYILVYMIYWNCSCKEQLRKLKKQTGLHVYAICSSLSRVYADHYLFGVGIEEFLWLVDNAEYVVTSSFHGAAMSAIFRKKFAAVVNPATPSRLENLLQTLDIPLVSIDCLATANNFDYSSICRNIDEERRRSLDYLSEAISG